MNKIKVKYFNQNCKLEEIATGNWIDVRASHTVEIKKGENALIRLGFAMKLPDGYEAHLAPRSSTFKKWHVLQTNSVGVIDNSYCGDDDEWMINFLAIEDTVIHEGDRIAQFRIMEVMPKLVFEEVDSLNEVSRGGFGSTGVR